MIMIFLPPWSMSKVHVNVGIDHDHDHDHDHDVLMIDVVRCWEDVAYYRFQMNWKIEREPPRLQVLEQNQLGLAQNQKMKSYWFLRHCTHFWRVADRPSPSKWQGQTFTMAELWQILDGDRFVLRRRGCNNFIIFIIYNIIRARGCVYIFIIPKIGFRIGDRSFGRSRCRRRRLGALTRLLTVLETQKFHPMVALLRGIWKS